MADGEPGPVVVNRYYLVLFQSGKPGDRLGDMNRLALQFIQDALDEAIESDADQNEIDVWLESPGGDASVAYKLFLDLRHRCKKLRVVIPDYAKSAATLFALGADEIYMAPAAELGPLDAQIEHPDREGVTVSALDVARAFDFLGDFAVYFGVSGGAEVLDWTGLPRLDVLREFLRFTARFLEPAVTKLDPHLTHRATNLLDVAQVYAGIMLNERSLAEEDERPDFDQESFTHHLIRHYPAHDFAISRKEAKKLKLPVRSTDAYDRWEKAKAYHKYFRHELFGKPGPCTVIQVCTDEELDEEPPDADGGQEQQDTKNANNIGSEERKGVEDEMSKNSCSTAAADGSGKAKRIRQGRP